MARIPHSKPKRIKLLIVGLLTAASVFGVTATAHAHTPTAADTVNISQGQIVHSTYFAAGRQITMDGEVEGDMFCGGQNVTISGHVQGDVICAAQTIRVTGQVDGDIRLASQEVTVSGQVGGNATVAAQTATIEKTGQIGRDLSVAATTATIDGPVARDLKAGTQSLTVNSPVGRDIDAHVADFALGRGATVGGNVSYESDHEVNKDKTAQISGRVTRHEPEHRNQNEAPRHWLAGFRLYLAVAMLVASLALVLLLPGMFKRTSDVALQSLPKTLLTGFLAALAVPVVIVFLMVTVIGIPLGLLTLLVWFVLLFLSGPVSAFLAGRLLLRQGQYSSLLIMLAGSALLLVLYLIPFLGALAALAAIWFGVGAIILAGWDARTSLSTRNAPSKKK